MHIDISRLRGFHEAAKSSHAALLEINARVRTARDERNRVRKAKEDHALFASTDRSNHLKDAELKRDMARHNAELAAAEAALASVETTAGTAEDRWRHASRLWASTRDFSRELGALPQDLQES